jgi:hypothetical protein
MTVIWAEPGPEETTTVEIYALYNLNSKAARRYAVPQHPIRTSHATAADNMPTRNSALGGYSVSITNRLSVTCCMLYAVCGPCELLLLRQGPTVQHGIMV